MRAAIRSLLRNRTFAAGTAATLALGIAVVVLMFAVLHAVVLRPLPYRDPERLVMLWTDDARRGIHEEGVGEPTVADWKRMARSFEDFALCGRSHTAILTDQPEPERVEVSIVSANLFGVLGASPVLGRVFTSGEDRSGARVALIGNALWQARFGGSRDAVGKTVELDGRPYQVIGVMPLDFHFPSKEVRAWIPVPDYSFWPGIRKRREADFFKVVGRMRPGVTVEQAQREMAAVGERLTAMYPSRDPEFAGYGVAVVPFQRQLLGESLPRALWLLWGACGLVLLVACANASGLMLARNAARAPDFAIRASLGATRGALLRQQVLEALVLSACAAAAGLAVASALLRAGVAIGSAAVPRLDEASVDGRVAAVAVIAAAISALLTGPIAAWRSSRAEARDALAAGARSIAPALRGQSWLVAGQVAFSVVLLSGAGLMVRSLIELRGVDPGFDTDSTVMVRVDRGARNSKIDTRTFWREVMARLNAIPGVKAGAIGDFFHERNADEVVTVEGQATVATEQVIRDQVTPGFFEAAGVRLLSGRLFTEADYEGRIRVAVINQTMARRFWPGRDPVGQRLKFAPAESRSRMFTVVGVVADMRRGALETAPIAQAFGPDFGPDMDLVVRSSRRAEAIPEIRSVIRSVDPSASIYGATTLEARLAGSTLPRRLQTGLLAGFAFAGLLLAAVGIYGTMAEAVNGRRREFGIRMALGARPDQIGRMVLFRALGLAMAGSLAGAALSVWTGSLLGALLFEVKPGDPRPVAAACVSMLAVAIVAASIPAWRALRLDPARAIAQ